MRLREAPESADLPLPTPDLLAPGSLHDRRLSAAAGLRRLFAALERLEAGRAEGPVRILQIGDSHTANDAFSGRMREVLQARFGAAGRGWLPAGIPFKYYRPQLVSVSAAGWRQLAISDRPPAAAVGIDAAVAQSEHPGASMTLVSGETEGFSRVAIEFLAQPQGGALSVQVDRQSPIRIPTCAPAFHAMRRGIPIDGHARQVELRAAEADPVHLIGWATERDQPGIIYENHGTIGATIDLLAQMSPAAVACELSDSRPTLIVIAFGTNEGFDPELDLQGYRANFRRQVDTLQRHAPQAAILILGPPDGDRLDCSTEPSAWREPHNLSAVRLMQKTAAAETGWAFWDWSQAMGGPGSMHRLVERDPPMALADHMHLNSSGYAASADVLLSALIREYQRWKNCHVPG